MIYYLLTLFVGLTAGAIFAWMYAASMVSASKERIRAAEAAAASSKVLADERTARANESAIATAEREAELSKLGQKLQARHGQLEQRAAELAAKLEEFDRRIIAYSELQDENQLLKRDLQNIDVNLRKLELDGEDREGRQVELEKRSTAMAKRYLSENVKAAVAAIGPSNFSACKNRLLDAIGRCRDIGFPVSVAEEASLLADLKQEFEREVRASIAREEQNRIKAQIREEERLKREVERELKQLDRERAAIQAALDQALAAAAGQHSAEVERLQARLTEAEEKARRAISMAQQTKAGNVYIISNVGTMGVDVYKIGMTRRLNPQERIDELGSASVPFPFDVHAMIRCENAPALENALHRALHKQRINKANPRKEFFKVDLPAIIRIVQENHGEIEYIAEAEALEYHQTLKMSEEDAAFVESVYEAVEEESDPDAE